MCQLCCFFHRLKDSKHISKMCHRHKCRSFCNGFFQHLKIHIFIFDGWKYDQFFPCFSAPLLPGNKIAVMLRYRHHHFISILCYVWQIRGSHQIDSLCRTSCKNNRSAFLHMKKICRLLSCPFIFIRHKTPPFMRAPVHISIVFFINPKTVYHRFRFLCCRCIIQINNVTFLKYRKIFFAFHPLSPLYN